MILIQKENNSDDDACAAICLMMALLHYKKNVTKEDVYRACDTVGSGNLALPWGICKAAAYYGLHIVHVSNHPLELINYNEVMQKSKKNLQEAQQYVEGLIQFCKEHANQIQLIPWEPGDFQLLDYVVEEKYGVIFPTLRWDEERDENHSVVVTEVTKSVVKFNNPNPKGITELSKLDFFEKWSHDKTDNDFFIVSENRIDIEKRRRILSRHFY